MVGVSTESSGLIRRLAGIIMTTTYIILAILGVIVFWAVYAYNRFITLINRTREAWSDIEVQMKRRYNLIPNLVETVKGYAAHEKGVLEKVTEARTAAMGAKSVKDHEGAENMLTGALKSLFAVSENYPELKANENFLELQRELSDTENKIQAARRFYNTNVRDLNTSIDSFPANIIARVFNFKKQDFFELEEEEAKEPVKVNF
jgi:LemA protein